MLGRSTASLYDLITLGGHFEVTNRESHDVSASFVCEQVRNRGDRPRIGVSSGHV